MACVLERLKEKLPEQGGEPREQKVSRLEENSSADLNDALTTAAAVDLAEGRAVHRSRGSSKIDEVEDVLDFTTQLELQRFVNIEGTEERSIDIPVTRNVKLHGPSVTEQAQRTYARASSIDSRTAVDRRIEPLSHLGNARFYGKGARGLSGDDARAIVAETGEVVVHTGCRLQSSR